MDRKHPSVCTRTSLTMQKRVEHKARAVYIHITTPRSLYISSCIACLQQRCSRLGERSCDRTRRRITNVVQCLVETVAAEQQVVYTRRDKHTRRFNQRTVGIRAVQELDWVADIGHSIGFHFLQHYRRGLDGRHAVIAIPAVTDGVAVNLVEHVAAAVSVEEAGRVDGAALGLWASKVVCLGRVGAQYVG